MKYFFLFWSFFSVIALAEGDQKLFMLYQKGQYNEACEYGYERFSENRQNEPFVSLLGFSCLKADQIDRLTPIIPLLHATPDARANGAYFSLLVMQKRLLMQALYDNKPLINLSFPTSAHPLSKVFDLYLKNPKKTGGVIEYQDPADPRSSYKLYPSDSRGRKSIAVDEYYDKILTVHHVY